VHVGTEASNNSAVRACASAAARTAISQGRCGEGCEQTHTRGAGGSLGKPSTSRPARKGLRSCKGIHGGGSREASGSKGWRRGQGNFGHAVWPGSMTGTLATDVRRVRRGGNKATQQAQLTILCTQVAPSPVRGGPDTLIGQQLRRLSLGANLHSPRGRQAAAGSEMSQSIKGSNSLAKAVWALTLAARAEEDSKANALGLGTAKAHKEEEQRKAEDKRR